MIPGIKKRYLFHLLGTAIVAFWLVMIGFLINKTYFGEPTSSSEQEEGPGFGGINSAQREWKEIFLKERKVGYAVNLVKPFKGGYLIQEEIFLRLNLMGLGSGLYTVTQCRADERFLLESFNFTMNSGAVRFQISGKVEGELLLIETGRGKERKTQRIKLAKPPMMGAGLAHYFKTRKITVGEVFRLPIFDPSSMAQKDALIKVSAIEPLTINRITYNAFRMEAEIWGKPITIWVAEDGTTLKEEGFMGLTAIRSSAARAPEDIDRKGGVDLYEMTAVTPDRALPEPTRLSYVKFEISGLDHATLTSGALNGGRQRFDRGILEVSKEKSHAEVSYLLPYNDRTAEMRAFMEPEFNIESGDEEIRLKAREVSGNDKDPSSVARKLVNWVYHNLEKRPVLSVPSASEVLRTRVGDCNEHATLLTAFLRAMGIPARISIGLVYTHDKFYYHAWNEAYLGEWVSMDATLNQMPADPTHIRFIEGNLDKQIQIAGLVGEIKLKVLGYRYD